MTDIRSAEVVLPCVRLDETVAFFTEQLAFRVESVFPADDPRDVVISGHGLHIRLSRDAAGPPGLLRLRGADAAAPLVAPNGTRIEIVAADPPLELPPGRATLEIGRARDGDGWRSGRAGMLYRDLLPDRQGGGLVASHIRIPDGGAVPDYVHYHRVHFQLIYCRRGWVRVVYEDQGPPFVMRPGDCVLQPPRIRHRVLECSDGLEVIEISCPAEHETLADHALDLPTDTHAPEREFGGQRFARHVAAAATWLPTPRCDVRDLGLGAASGGVVEARVRRLVGGEPDAPEPPHDSEPHDSEPQDSAPLFGFVLDGAVTLGCGGRDAERLQAGDAFVVPAGMPWRASDGGAGFELLEVRAWWTRPPAPPYSAR